jgi:3-oxoacyl-[acyl-carrier protein] reductase
MDLGLAGRTALVLGGGGGLGRAIAKALAREGARVAVGDINAAALDATVREIEGVGS